MVLDAYIDMFASNVARTRRLWRRQKSFGGNYNFYLCDDERRRNVYIYGFICAPVIIYVTHIESGALLWCFVDLKDDDALKQVARGFVLFERCVLTKSCSKNANIQIIYDVLLLIVCKMCLTFSLRGS